MNSEQKQAFDLSREPDAVREAYGQPAQGDRARRRVRRTSTAGSGGFGQGCLMARRLVEAGVPFVEVVMGDGVGWDTHRDNFPRTKALSLECDTAMSALVKDLAAARAARHDAGRVDGRVRPDAPVRRRRPQPLGAGLEQRADRRRHQGRPGRRQDRPGRGRGRRNRPISVTDFLGTVCTILGIDYKREEPPAGCGPPDPDRRHQQGGQGDLRTAVGDSGVQHALYD